MYKIAVYAICKNESQFVDRWADSVADADEVVVVDTGSEDDSVTRLREHGFRVYEENITPWRFDAARNRALEMVSEDIDICVSIDLDEIFVPGWRQALERAWAQGAQRVEYRYVWSFNPDGSEGVVFWISKIHARHGFRWVNPVHEVLTCNFSEKLVRADGLQVDHHPDHTKSRAQYLPLLEMAVAENPNNDRNMHYLGREYMFRGRWLECIETLKRHVSMPEATWADEKCASYRFMARAYGQLGDDANAFRCLLNAIALAPHLREPWMEMAKYCYHKENWYGVVWNVENALKIRERPSTYINDAESWGALPYDLASLGYYYLGQREKAFENINLALEITPNDARLRSNLKYMSPEQ